MDVECDECGRTQKMKPKMKRLKDKVEKHYFECEHCNHIYLICYMDDDIKREQKRIRKLVRKNRGNGFYTDKIEQKEMLIKNKMNELKEKIETLT